MMRQLVLWKNDVDSTTGPLFGIIFRNANGNGTRKLDGEADAAESRHFLTLKLCVHVRRRSGNCELDRPYVMEIQDNRATTTLQESRLFDH